MLARLLNNTVVEIYRAIDGFSLSDCYHPDILASAESVPDYVTVGSTLADGAWYDTEGNAFIEIEEEPPIEEPVSETPVTEELAPEAAAEEPVAEEPVAEEPVA